MYTSMKQMLAHANENNYAVMAVNCINFEVAKAIIGAAEEAKSPVIVNISPRQFKAHATLEMIVPMIKTYAQSVNVPVALNLDHGQEYEDIVYALKNGFSSIMFDGSSLSYEQNVSRTKLIRSLTSEYCCSLEAELGHVGQAVAGDNNKEDFLTNPSQALDFIKQTNADFLAVAIGTAHGEYPKGMIPEIDFARLQEIKESVKIPLVLHGGSGAGAKNIKRAVSLGINKINVCTDLFNVGRDSMRQQLADNPNTDLLTLEVEAEKAMRSYIIDYMTLIGSNNRYTYSNGIVTEVE